MSVPHPVDAFIALGANLGDPAAQVLDAMAALALLDQTRLLDCSSLYRSRAVGHTEQPDFINAVVHVRTRLTARGLLQACLDIEVRFGRQRTFKNAPRTLDLDLLLYDGLVTHSAGLTLPHPRMHQRAFVLQPLVEIAPDCVIPGQGSAQQLLGRIAGDSPIRLPDATHCALGG